MAELRSIRYGKPFTICGVPGQKKIAFAIARMLDMTRLELCARRLKETSQLKNNSGSGRSELRAGFSSLEVISSKGW